MFDISNLDYKKYNRIRNWVTKDIGIMKKEFCGKDSIPLQVI